MKITFAALCLALLAVWPVAVQQRFTSATTLLTVDATVTDANGAPVPGLTAADFQVRLNGKTQPVRAVAFLQASSTSAPESAAPGVRAATPLPTAMRSAPADPRVFVLLLDDLSIRAGNSKGLLVSAERFVSKLPLGDIVGFTTTSGQVTVNPTTDHAALMKRLRRAQGELFDPREFLGRPIVGMIEALQMAKAAAAAGVQLTVMVEEPDLFDPPGVYKDNRALSQAAQTLTDMSGGQFYSVIGQAERFYDRVLQSASAVYRLGVELPSDLAAGADVVVQVAVAKRGLTVHASHHSVAPAPPFRPLPVEQQLKNAISSGQPNYSVPLTLNPEVVRTPGTGQLAIRVVIEVPSGVPGPLIGVFGLVDETGALKSVPRAPERLAGGNYRLEFLVPVVPGKYRLRFAVADATGAVGSIEVVTIAK